MMKKTIISFVLVLLCVVGGHAAKKNNGIVKFNLYGSDVQIRFDASKRVKVKKATDAEIDKYFKWLDGCIDQTLEDCLKQKQELDLCDWAYLKMLDKFSTTVLGQSNEATLLMAGLLGASGYNTCVIRFQNGQLRALYHTDAFVYNQMFFTNNNKQYFLYGDTTNISGSAKIVMTMEKSDGKMIDFRQTPVIKAVTLTEPRKLTSKKSPDFSFTVQVNKNLVDFYDDMPSFTYDNNFMSRWTSMANRPLEKHLQQTLIKEMKAKLQGKSQQEQVQQLLWWTQGTVDLERQTPNAENFLFAYDEDIWGRDRAFYAEETLFYPYCDTEDRSILLSRLVRDVVGLDVIFIYYPEHTAIGVCFTDEYVKGAFVVKDGRYYLICDPTYIGSKVGEEMPNMEGKERTIMKLER